LSVSNTYLKLHITESKKNRGINRRKGEGEVVISVITCGEHSGYQDIIASAPVCSLIITGNYPHLERWSVLQGSAVP
jgi:hypothetical protein